MRKPFAVLTALALLVAGCATRQANPTPANPTQTTPAQTAPGPATGEAPAQMPPTLDLSQVKYIDLSAARPGNPTVRLLPHEHEAQIRTLLAALGASRGERIERPNCAQRIQAGLQQTSGDFLSLCLPTEGETVEATWGGIVVTINSPSLTRALSALEPELEKAQKPGIQLWAIDTMGGMAPELAWESSKQLSLEALSPDSRYAFLLERHGEYKGDYRAAPFLLDRQTGELKEGPETFARFGIWSGAGFYVDWTTHLDLELKESRLTRLESLLQLKQGDREVLASSFTPDGKHFAMVVGKPWGIQDQQLDLIQGNTDGTNVTITQPSLTGADTQIGTLVRVWLSSDARSLVLAGKDGTFVVPAASPDLKGRSPVHQMYVLTAVWSPDSRYVWIPPAGIFTSDGKQVVQPAPGYAGVWQPDSEGLVTNGDDGIQLVRLDGTRKTLKSTTWMLPAGFLRDGTLLAWRTLIAPR